MCVRVCVVEGVCIFVCENVFCVCVCVCSYLHMCA